MDLRSTGHLQLKRLRNTMRRKIRLLTVWTALEAVDIYYIISFTVWPAAWNTLFTPSSTHFGTLVAAVAKVTPTTIVMKATAAATAATTTPVEAPMTVTVLGFRHRAAAAWALAPGTHRITHRVLGMYRSMNPHFQVAVLLHTSRHFKVQFCTQKSFCCAYSIIFHHHLFLFDLSGNAHTSVRYTLVAR